MYTGLRVKYQLFLSYFNETWIFLTDFLKKRNFVKICPVKSELLMQTAGQTDMTKLIVAFRNFTNAPKKVKLTVFTE
jgi:hypothetical protein